MTHTTLIKELTDDSPMPFGMHKGKPMEKVPVHWLHWFYCNGNCDTTSCLAVLQYIKKNLAALKAEDKDLIWGSLG